MSAVLLLGPLGVQVAVSYHDTPTKASRKAHRWLRRKFVALEEWATILDQETGVVLARYARRSNGRVERMQ